MNKYDSVIFDLDGTLWDATPITVESWSYVLSRHREVHPAVNIDCETVRKYMGLTIEELSGIIFPKLDFETAFSLFMESCEAENRLIEERCGNLYEGVRETLAILKNKKIRLFVVSNCQTGYIEAFINAHRFEGFFDDFESSGNTGRPKGDNIRDIIVRNGIESAVYVGDTVSDRDGACEAGIPFIYAKYGFGEKYGRGRVNEYNMSISNPRELVGIIGG